jgi:hypothetical protein
MMIPLIHGASSWSAWSWEGWTALEAIGTLGAFAAGGALLFWETRKFREERVLRELRDEEARRSHALAVVAWSEDPRRGEEDQDHPWWHWTLVVSNTSRFPIFNVQCSIDDHNLRRDVELDEFDPDPSRFWRRALAPGAEWTIEEARRYVGPGACLDELLVDVQFTDAWGQAWQRKGPNLIAIPEDADMVDPIDGA